MDFKTHQECFSLFPSKDSGRGPLYCQAGQSAVGLSRIPRVLVHALFERVLGKREPCPSPFLFQQVNAP